MMIRAMNMKKYGMIKCLLQTVNNKEASEEDTTQEVINTMNNKQEHNMEHK